MMQRPKYRSLSGFSLVEALVALLLINITVVSMYGGLTKLNEYAAINRLNTCATALAQARIDRSLVDKPFDPGENRVHADLKLGSEVTPNVAIYKNPDNNQVLVSGTMTTTVSSTTLPIVTTGTLGNVTLQQTTVSVAYGYKGINYNVQMTCLRSPDKAQ